MKHPSSRELFDYWNRCRGSRAAPERADIEPSAIRRVLADTFILSCDETGGYRFRIAGTRVCALFGRELKNDRFLDLWSDKSRVLVHDLLTVVSHESVGVIASVTASSTDGSTQELELLALPLKHRGRTAARLLGAMAPNTGRWLGTATLHPLTLGVLRYLGAGFEDATLPAPARPPGRVRHGFTIYDGGQA